MKCGGSQALDLGASNFLKSKCEILQRFSCTGLTVLSLCNRNLERVQTEYLIWGFGGDVAFFFC